MKALAPISDYIPPDGCHALAMGSDRQQNIAVKVLAVPEVILQLSRKLSGLGVRYSWGEGHHPLVGQRVPDSKLQTNSGEKKLFSLMFNERPLLLNFGKQHEMSLSEKYQSRVDVIEGIPQVENNGNAWKLAVVGEVPELTGVFVRPDGFVAWAQSAGEEYEITP